MTREEKIEFTREWLLLCEGLSDKHFFHQLIKHHQVGVGKFNIYFPGRRKSGGGNGKFATFLSSALATRPEFRENVRAVLIVADNDDDPARSFEEIRRALEAEEFPAPAREREVARKAGYPAVVVAMIPKNAPGNLETLCVPAAYSKWGLEAPLNTYVSATPANGWNVGKKSKMQLHAMLAATCATKPETSLAHIWQEDEQYHLPLDDKSFTDLVELLNDFEALIAT